MNKNCNQRHHELQCLPVPVACFTLKSGGAHPHLHAPAPRTTSVPAAPPSPPTRADLPLTSILPIFPFLRRCFFNVCVTWLRHLLLQEETRGEASGEAAHAVGFQGATPLPCFFFFFLLLPWWCQLCGKEERGRCAEDAGLISHE